MTEYVIREVGSRQWLVFADRRCIAFCANENEAVKAMNGHSARTRLARDEIAPQPLQEAISPQSGAAFQTHGTQELAAVPDG
ncbi:hypothetical protein [Bradyrhizobium sp. CCGUVB23]|uniref:hypothetical protein n=1 Tax=Bradyrhizobium sp. CCGUVB23 TaxID=2949630 RepID=UPI0020B43D34|nr:hypothetical protein [Bradyrhizobium sp. CCGUVB23]MCP3466693.1 hypothetical protein [Bradyrhizobium sp. CCGUVB23]